MKLLKVYISVFCMCSLSVLLNSCDDFLKEEPLDMKSSDQFWKTKADAESGVNALYFGGVPYLHNTDVGGGWTPKATMWGGIVSGLYVDKRKDRTFTTASEGCNFNIESFDDIAMKYWHEFYKGISRANFVIANIPTMTGVLDE
ncbi:RagB/SusD family nutrient uptake outer membrane protein, partial [Bacteroides xylanisolvens]